MPLRDDAEGWGWPSRLLHWVMAALMTGLLILGLVAANVVDDLQTRFELTQWHKSFGVVVFALALVRLGWRAANRTRPAPPPGPEWERRAARAGHAAFYALMLLLPLSGWLMASASPLQDMFGLTDTVFGLIPLPDPFVPGAEATEAAFRAVHLGAAIALAALLALHAGAALRHHLVLKDGVLRRMTLGRTAPAAERP